MGNFTRLLVMVDGKLWKHWVLGLICRHLLAICENLMILLLEIIFVGILIWVDEIYTPKH